jgi:hypothetical protein
MKNRPRRLPIADASFQAGYVSRRHDEVIRELFRSKRRGNYLLVGYSGSGKSASLTHFSDFLLNVGSEFQLIPCAFGRDFVPPLARINLVDDIDVLLLRSSPDHELISALNKSRPRSLNIITSCFPEEKSIRSLLDVDDIVQIPRPSAAEMNEFYEKLLHRVEKVTPEKEIYLKMLKEYLSGTRVHGPKEMLSGLISEGDRGFQFKGSLDGRKLEIIRPRLVILRNEVLAKVASNPHHLFAMSPIEFERVIGELFEKEGYSVDFTKKSRDGGVDIFAWKRDIGGEFLTIVQCKRYDSQNPVTVNVVREVIGSINVHSATAGAIFTTSRFTKPAIEESKKVKYRLSLNDYFDILTSIAKHQP